MGVNVMVSRGTSRKERCPYKLVSFPASQMHHLPVELFGGPSGPIWACLLPRDIHGLRSTCAYMHRNVLKPGPMDLTGRQDDLPTGSWVAYLRTLLVLDTRDIGLVLWRACSFPELSRLHLKRETNFAALIRQRMLGPTPAAESLIIPSLLDLCVVLVSHKECAFLADLWRTGMTPAIRKLSLDGTFLDYQRWPHAFGTLLSVVATTGPALQSLSITYTCAGMLVRLPLKASVQHLSISVESLCCSCALCAQLDRGALHTMASGEPALNGVVSLSVALAHETTWPGDISSDDVLIALLGRLLMVHHLHISCSKLSALVLTTLMGLPCLTSLRVSLTDPGQPDSVAAVCRALLSTHRRIDACFVHTMASASHGYAVNTAQGVTVLRIALWETYPLPALRTALASLGLQLVTAWDCNWLMCTPAPPLNTPKAQKRRGI